jgi:hypothetical protein
VSRGLNLTHFQHSLGIGNISHDCQPAETGNNLAQEFESLASSVGLLDRQSSDVATRSRQTDDQAAADRIDRNRKDDGDRRCRLFYCGDSGSIRNNDINIQADKLGCDLSVALGSSLRPAIIDRDGAALGPAEFTQSP